jgi:hypothetical protein
MATLDIYRSNPQWKFNKYATLSQKRVQMSSEITKTGAPQ